MTANILKVTAEKVGKELYGGTAFIQSI